MEKIAIIDLGSNTARLLLVKVLDGGYFVVFDEMKESVRLAQDMETDGFLKPSRISATIKTLKMFKKLCDANKISKIMAYATAAVRRAKNQRSFIDEIAVTCGIKVRVLSAEEEATLIYNGVINSLDVPKGLIMDIGGGSVQLIYYNRKHLLNHITLPFGAITLTDMVKNMGLTPEERVVEIEKVVKEGLSGAEWLKELDPDTQFIGVGGSFRNLAKIARYVKKYPLSMPHNYHIASGEFGAIYDTLKIIEIEKTANIKGVSGERADIFPSALASIRAVIDYTGIFKDIVISGSGLREGAMFRYAVPTTVEKPISDILGYGINTMLYNFNMNIPHAEHVYSLSVQLFKQLKVLHKLPRFYVKVLRTAALLHDAGSIVKYYDHHIHSEYIILNSGLNGISHKDLVMAAYVAALHRNSDNIEVTFDKYKELLTEEDLDAVKKLGVILRIAESFDRSRSGLIVGLNCDVLGDSVIMKTQAEGDSALEIKDAMKASNEFRKAFKKNLEIL
ncbi:MAG: Ppx/GppA family phosphatase [Clostridiales bacterium]|jgi:exopolyphosphatase/guanosine-5'-triphosphate,3'-diphosphate pyrophosphatase|nr:Ppx/GppA family phosphatase [Clostridiales bacterium]